MEAHLSDRQTPGSALLDVRQVASRLGVTTRFVRRLVDERRIPFCKIGKFVRFDPDDLEAWIAERRVDSVA
jgi:excisionase family DNA binding protein